MLAELRPAGMDGKQATYMKIFQNANGLRWYRARDGEEGVEDGSERQAWARAGRQRTLLGLQG